MEEDFFESFERESRAAGLTFLVIGGHAVNAYGYQRTTLDADFLIQEASLGAWRAFLTKRGYACVHISDAFAQFRSADAVPRFPVDLLLVNDETFKKLSDKKQARAVGGAMLSVPDPLHLIALKLHALRNRERAKLGKDLQDVIGLIHRCKVDVQSAEFEEILTRYADENTRNEIKRLV